MVVSRPPQVLQCRERVEAGKAGWRQSPAHGVEPERGRAGQDADAMIGPDRRPVLQALCIVPHPVFVDRRAAGRARDRDAAPVHMGRHATHHVVRPLAQPVARPRLAHRLHVAADAARRHDHGRGMKAERSGDLAVRGLPARCIGRCENIAADARDGSVRRLDRVDPMPKREAGAASRLVFAHPPGERRQRAGPGAPCDMEARHGVAVPVCIRAAALGPSDDWKPSHAHARKPRAHLARGEVEIGFRPQSRPVVLFAVELRRTHPVPRRQEEAVADSQPALFGRVDHEQPAERPESLSAERLFALLVDDQDALAAVAQLGRRGKAGQPRADDDGVE